MAGTTDDFAGRPHEAANAIVAAAPGITPRVALVLGSGLGGIAAGIKPTAVLDYGDIPGFPVPKVAGHAGKLILGELAGQKVACLQGRVHFYEGHSPAPLKTMIRAMKLIGCEMLYLTCAAGSLRPEIGPGALMPIGDHLNLMGMNPLVGPNEDEFGPRFPPMANAWDKALLEHQLAAGKDVGLTMTPGTYAAFMGPTFETPAEVRMAMTLGAHAVGMSTVPECIVARHCGLKVTGTAAITNLGEGLSDEALSHEQTLRGAVDAAAGLEKLIPRFLATLPASLPR
ncbi:purine-nucleoside phosphorylase [Radicibacter daui]|uniref:purine-nucleoside phosphorylase n=1 Tax=Radicibacter daui TaxID=3064829 RepID=UPI004046DC5A